MITKWRFRPILLLAVLALLLSGCGSSQNTPPPPTATPQPATAIPQPPSAGLTATPQAATTSSPYPPNVQAALDHLVRMEEGAVLATVNGEEVTWEDYEPGIHQRLFAISEQSDVDWSDPVMQERLKILQNNVLKDTVDRWILREMAAEQGVAVSDADLEAAVESEKSAVLGSKRYADWATFMEIYGLTDDSFRLLIYDKLLLNALAAKQTVETEAQQVHLRHIVVADLATAQTVVQELKAGRDYAEAAAQYSLDDETKGSGGDLGWASEDMLLPEIQTAVLSLSPGQFSEPVQTQGGYAIIQVVERGIRPLEARFIAQKQREVVMTQLEALRATADIEYLVDFTKVVTDTP